MNIDTKSKDDLKKRKAITLETLKRKRNYILKNPYSFKIWIWV